MRKYHIFLSLCVVAAFLLAACGGSTQSATSTTTGGIPVTGNGTQTAAPSTNGTTGAGTSSTTETSAAPSTTGTSQSTQAGGASSGTTATAEGTAQGTPSSTTMAGTGQVDPGLLSNELQFQVVDKNNNQIGQVKDFVLDLTKMQVVYVVVTPTQSTGGSSTKEVAVPWSMMQVQGASASSSTGSASSTGTPSSSGTVSSTGTPAATSSSGSASSTGTPAATSSTGGSSGSAQGNFKGTFVFNGDTSLFNNAPDFTTVTVPQFGAATTTGWDSSLQSYWTGNSSSTSSTPTVAATATAVGTATATQSTTGGSSGVTMLQGVVLFSKAVGMKVTDTNNQQLAQVTDFVLDLTNNLGNLTYVILTVNNKLVPVPLSMFKVDTQNQNLVLAVTSQVLQAATNFDMGALPMTLTSDWDTAIKVFWNNLQNSGQSGSSGGQSTQTTMTVQPTSTP